MKISSLAIWVFILYIIQNTFCPIIGITNLNPELMLAFVATYAVFEHRFGRLSKVIIICAMLSATGVGRSFPIVTFLIGMGGIASYLSVNYLRFVPQIIRTLLVVAVFSFVLSVAETFVFKGQLIIDTAIWYTVYTTAISLVMYIILKKVILKEKEKKILIAQERN